MRRLIDWLARAFAFAGGSVLVALTGMSVASIAGRTILGKPIQGDFELVQISCAVCVAAFLPYCQSKRGNIIVDFFTTRAPARVKAGLDAFGALLVALMTGVLAWRTGVGALAVKASGESFMILGLPVWIGYAAMVPSFALTSVVALFGALESWTARRPRAAGPSP
ncbi:MAG: TRAP transporter small permease [Betaproteobacteria bacterium]|nr:TRAP transporter small permease [Betaproteobacteria bacterium]